MSEETETIAIYKHTHPMIRSKVLRAAYARELLQQRVLRSAFTPNEFEAMKLGIESGVWAVQKFLLQDAA